VISNGPNSNVFLHKILHKKETLFIQMVSNSIPIWNIWSVVNAIRFYFHEDNQHPAWSRSMLKSLQKGYYILVLQMSMAGWMIAFQNAPWLDYCPYDF
jgi:hypothetical protein